MGVLGRQLGVRNCGVHKYGVLRFERTNHPQMNTLSRQVGGLHLLGGTGGITHFSLVGAQAPGVQGVIGIIGNGKLLAPFTRIF